MRDQPSSGGAYGKVSVTSTATVIKVPNSSRTSIILYNEGANPCRIGFDSTVTSGGANDGILLPVGGSLSLGNIGLIYAICAAAQTATVSYIENRLS